MPKMAPAGSSRCVWPSAMRTAQLCLFVEHNREIPGPVYDVAKRLAALPLHTLAEPRNRALVDALVDGHLAGGECAGAPIAQKGPSECGYTLPVLLDEPHERQQV